MNINSQGGKANRYGHTLENIISSILQNKGFNILKYSEYNKNPSKFGEEVLLIDAPYETIYGHKGKTEFLLHSLKYHLDARIECKWQQVPGSVDEKFPYLYLNCIENIPEETILIVIDGRGAKPGAIEWLKHACKDKLYTNEKTKAKNIIVMTIDEFVKWANSYFQ